MSYSKIFRKTVFNIWLVGMLNCGATLIGLMLSMIVPYIGYVIFFMIDYGIFFLASMVFLWKMSENHGYTLGLENKFDKKKYLIGVLIGILINIAFFLLLSPIPIINFIPAILNYYYIFPYNIISDFLLLPKESISGYVYLPDLIATYTSFLIDTPILFAVMFFGACSGDKYATFIRESTEIETDSSELLEQERTTTPRKPGTSWRDSVKRGE